MLRLERLRLHDFRGFAELELDFSPKGSTVIVGVNGAGKTTVLVAIAELLSQFARQLGHGEGPLHPTWDLRTGETKGGGSLELALRPPQGSGEQRQCFSFKLLPAYEGNVGISAVPAPTELIRGWRQALSETPAQAAVPALAYYSVDREYQGGADSQIPLPPLSQLAAYVGAFSSARAGFHHFAAWFREREDLENEQIRDAPQYRDPMLVAVRTAIETIVGGALNSLRVRRDRRRGATIVIQKNNVELDLNQLSHGERGLLALAGDIARRLAMTHPGLQDPLQGHGVVLIDEIELHLHPQWQRRVIPDLERTFPNVQFVLTTHSPQVLSLVRPEQLRILDGFSLVQGAPHTYGRDSNSILSEVMGVDQYPPFAAERVRKVSRLIDDERWDDARRELDALAKDFGRGDAEVVRLGTMLEVLRDDEEPA